MCGSREGEKQASRQERRSFYPLPFHHHGREAVLLEAEAVSGGTTEGEYGVGLLVFILSHSLHTHSLNRKPGNECVCEGGTGHFRKTAGNNRSC